MTRRSDSLPPPRATVLYAKTIHRELRRAGYQRADLVRFVGDLMGLISEGNSVESERDRRLVGVLDQETGLPNPQVADEIIDFEIVRALEGKLSGLLVIALDVSIPDSLPGEVASHVHVQTAVTLRRQFRADDTVLRLAPRTYFCVLPNVGASLVPSLVERLTRSLHAETQDPEEWLPLGVRYAVRTLVWQPTMKKAGALVDACMREPATPLEREWQQGSDDAPVSRLEVGRIVGPAIVAPRPKTESTGSRGVVLALGGGAGRAVAHVGAIRMLTEMGVEIRGIAGTSAGALVGAMYLSGLSPDEIIDRFERFAGSASYQHLRRLYAMYLRRARRTRTRWTNPYFRQSGWSTLSDTDLAAVPDNVYAEFIEFFVGPDCDISTLTKPFAATATDLVDGRPCIFSRGPLHVALRASCALPGLFAPQRESGRLFIDGAIVADVPVKAAIHLQLDAKVLAFYLERPSHRVTEYSTSSEVLTRASSLVHTELVREQLRHAPILVTAHVAEVGWLDFRQARQTAALGEAAVRDVQDDILQRLSR